MAKFIGIVLALVIVLGYVVPAAFLSSSYAAERGTVIEAPPTAVRAVVDDFNTWESWSAWNLERDPGMTRTVTGTPGTVGHRMAWTSEKDGNGEMEILLVEPDRTVFALRFEGMAPAETVIAYGANGASGTDVTWTMSGEFEGQPFWRWMGLVMNRMVGPDFEKGLANLKAKVEAKTPAQGE